MERDSLEQLLRDADADTRPGTSSPAPRVVAEHAWRRRDRALCVRRAAGAGVVAAVALGSLVLVLSVQRSQPELVSRTPEPIHAPQDAPQHAPQPPRAPYDDGALQEAVALRVVEAYEARQRARAVRRAPLLELHREQATLLLLYQGDQLAQHPALGDPARVAYRQASELFPETHAAAAARQRLGSVN